MEEIEKSRLKLHANIHTSAGGGEGGERERAYHISAFDKLARIVIDLCGTRTRVDRSLPFLAIVIIHRRATIVVVPRTSHLHVAIATTARPPILLESPRRHLGQRQVVAFGSRFRGQFAAAEGREERNEFAGTETEREPSLLYKCVSRPRCLSSSVRLSRGRCARCRTMKYSRCSEVLLIDQQFGGHFPRLTRPRRMADPAPAANGERTNRSERTSIRYFIKSGKFLTSTSRFFRFPYRTEFAKRPEISQRA